MLFVDSGTLALTVERQSAHGQKLKCRLDLDGIKQF